MLAPVDDRAAFLAEKVGSIRALAKTAVRDVVEIGRHLSEVKERFGRGENPEFLTWAQESLGWGQRSIYRFLSVYDLSQKGDFASLAKSDLDISSLYLLAAPSTPAAVVDTVIERAANGETISHKEVARRIDEAREEARFAAAEETERRIAIERAKAAEREREIRTQYADKIGADEVDEMISKTNKPLKDKVKHLELQVERHQQAEEQRKKGAAPKIDADIQLRATGIGMAIDSLRETLTITPTQMVQIERATADVTGQTIMELLGPSAEHAATAVAWMQEFLTAYKEAIR